MLTLPSESFSVAVNVRLKFVVPVGVIERLDSVQFVTSTEVCPAVAVNVWL